MLSVLRPQRTPKFSVENALSLCKALEQLEENGGTLPASVRRNDDNFITVFRELAEVMVWGDKHEEMIFDRVLERDVMSTLERLVTNAQVPSIVKAQVFQCVTMLLQHLTRASSVYVLCSNHHINRMIASELDPNDEELVAVHISFLKTLALRLDDNTVQFFFESETGAFPLFDKAVKLLSVSDSMVRTAARQVVVSVAQLTDDGVAAFLSVSLSDVFTVVARSVADHVASLEKLVTVAMAGGEAAMEPTTFARAFSNCLEDAVDDLYYINDLCECPQKGAEAQLLACLEKDVLLPMRASIEAAEDNNNNNNNVCGGRKSELSCATVQISAAAVALAFLARWMLVNDVSALRELVIQDYVCQSGAVGDVTAQTPSVGAPEHGVLLRIFERPHLANYSGALLLMMALLKEDVETVVLNEDQEDADDAGDAYGEEDHIAHVMTTAATFTAEDFFNEGIPSTLLQELPSDAVGQAKRKALGSLVAALYHQVKAPAQCSIDYLHLTMVLLHTLLSQAVRPGCKRHAWRHFLGCALNVSSKRVRLVEALYEDGRDGCSSSSCPSAEWRHALNRLCEPLSSYEAAFLRLRLAARQFRALPPHLISLQHTPAAKNVMSFLPTFCSLSGTESLAWEHTVWRLLGAPRTLTDRTALTATETETVTCLTWLLLMRLSGRDLGGVHEAALAGPLSILGEKISAHSTTAYWRCEVVRVSYADAARHPLVAPGTPACIALTLTREVVLCTPANNVDRGTSLGTIFVSLDAVFVYALQHSKYPFKVQLRFCEPGHRATYWITLRDADAARCVTDTVNSLARETRQQGASLCRLLLEEGKTCTT